MVKDKAGRDKKADKAAVKVEETATVEVVAAQYYDEVSGELKPVENGSVPASETYTGELD